MLWEGLTGRRLVSGDNDAMLLHKMLDGRIDAPSVHCADIPRELDELVLRALATKPALRFATAREMARALEGTVAVASASVIGEWVEDLARDKLADRAKQVELVEESSTILGSSPLPEGVEPALGTGRDTVADAPGDVTRSLPARAHDGVAHSDATPTQLSSAQTFLPRPSRMRRARVLAVAGAIAVLGLTVLVLRRWTAAPPASSQVVLPANDVREVVSVAPALPPSSVAPVAPTVTADAMTTATSGAGVVVRRSLPRPVQAPAPARAGRDLDRAIDSRK
jgi:serine/threonine-protein kinase